MGAAIAALALLLAASACGDDGAPDGAAAPAGTTTRAGTTTVTEAPGTTKSATTTTGAKTGKPTTTATPTGKGSTTTSAPRTTTGSAGATTTTTKAAPRTTTAAPSVKGRRINFQPRLRVEASRYDAVRGSHLTIDVTQGATERAMSRISIAIPAGYGLNPLAPGKRAGEITVDLAGAGKLAQLPPLVLQGDLRTTRRIGSSCVAKPTWVLRAVAVPEAESLQPVRVPLTVFVHKASGSRRIEICLPKGPFAGNRTIRRVALKITSGLVPPGPGDAVWRGVFTPRLGAPAAELASTTSSQGIVRLPSFLTLEAAGKPTALVGTTITLRGTLSLNGPVAGAPVQVLVASDRRGFRPAGKVKTGANGSFTFRMKAPSRPGLVFFQARATSQPVPCAAAPSADAPAGCTSATVSGISSASIRITLTR